MIDRIIRNIPDYDKAGIYMLKNTVTGKVYIGSSCDVRQRIIAHDYAMRNGQANQKMLPDIAEGHKFDCIIVEKYDNITLAELLDKENFYVHQYNSFYEGYNMACVPTYDVEFFRRTGNTHVVEWLEKKV